MYLTRNRDILHLNSRLLMRVLIPIILLVTGIMLLFLKIPGWSVIVGLPLVVVGSLFLIYIYDSVLSDNIYIEGDSNLVRCSKCGQLVECFIGCNKKRYICDDCSGE